MNPTFNPREFLDLARDLASSNNEANLRAGIGRAYYAIFLIARDKAGFTRKQGTHDKVISAVRKRKGRGTSDKLGSLRKLRGVADYQLIPEDPNDSNWRNNWTRADAIVDDIFLRIENW